MGQSGFWDLDSGGLLYLRSGYLMSSAGMTDGVDCGWVLWTKALMLLVRPTPTKAALGCELLGRLLGASWGEPAGSSGVSSTRETSNCSSSSDRSNSLSLSGAMMAAVEVIHASFCIRTHH